MWFLTVIGLCFGGGQTVLGVAAALIGLFTLTALNFLEKLPRKTSKGACW